VQSPLLIPPKVAAFPVPAQLRRSGETLALYKFRWDDRAELIRGEARGCWSPDETDSYLADLRNFVVASRSLIGKVRVLLDRRDVTVQSPEVAERLANANRAIFMGEDRIALVVDSSLMKVSLRKRMPHAGTKAFLSIDAAETWLRA
jgi:hypothetical protein